jgi:hypothetical protein
MDHVGVKTYERKKLERKLEESAAAAIDRTQSADMNFNDEDVLSSNDMEERAATQSQVGLGKKKGHKVAEYFSTTEIVSNFQI